MDPIFKRIPLGRFHCSEKADIFLRHDFHLLGLDAVIQATERAMLLLVTFSLVGVVRSGEGGKRHRKIWSPGPPMLVYLVPNF